MLQRVAVNGKGIKPSPRNCTYTMSVTAQHDLDQVKARIEKLSVNYQIEILSILVKGGVKINENKSGIRLNMNFLLENNRPVFDEMVKYLQYAEEKESRLDTFEQEKQEINNTYFAYS